MKCINCGKESEHYLCDFCMTQAILDKIFNEIRYFKPDTCENPYLMEYVAGCTEKYAERDIIPDILNQFDFEVSEFYYCQYYRMRRDERFEAAAVTYLQSHDLSDIRTQSVLYDLIDSYIPNNFVEPKSWCELMLESDNYCCELYAVAAKYFGMIGDYDLSDILVDKGIENCNDVEKRKLLFYSPENMILRLEKQKEDTKRYRTKKPYWPTTEERRRAVAVFYDEKGIKYPRIEKRPEKVPENEFTPISECFDDKLIDYCTFWCSEVFSPSTQKCIYQIAAYKVCDNNVVGSFESYIRPWDASMNARKAAAKEIGVTLDVIDSAEDVDLVLPRFFQFVDNTVLVSTGALGNQGKLISRAARYSGMREIKNEFYDLLDLAADTSADFDLINNTREHLLSYFSIKEGKTALEKAQANKLLYDALMNYGG